MKVLVTGATGLIGRSLCRLLAGEGHKVIALSRAPGSAGLLAAAEVHKWEPQVGPPPPEALSGVEAVVHLAGEPIAARRWTDEQKKRIRDSRVISTRHLVNGLSALNAKPSVLVSGSAVGYYGDRGDEQLDEDSPAGSGFLSDICKQWEAEAQRAADSAIRVVLVRTGVVLSREGGALKKMLPAFNFGVAGPLGDGRQWFPWIHIDDIVGILRLSIDQASIEGPVNGVAPGVVTNKEFTKQLASALNRPAFLPVPGFGLRLLMGEMADALLGSQRVIPGAALKAGYDFLYPDLAPALKELLDRRKAA